MMFKGGFEKIAVLGGALIGAALGGEKDEQNPDHKKNRSIGALRGAAASAGMHAGAHLGLAGKGGDNLHKALRGKAVKGKEIHKALGKANVGSILGGLGAYYAAKKLGPKYDKETKKEG